MDDQKRYINYTFIDAVGTPTHGQLWANLPRAEDEVRRRVQASAPGDERVIALYLYDTGTKCLYGWNVQRDGTLEVMSMRDSPIVNRVMSPREAVDAAFERDLDRHLESTREKP